MSLLSSSTVQVSEDVDFGRMDLAEEELALFSLLKNRAMSVLEISRRSDQTTRKIRLTLENMIDQGVVEIVETAEDEENPFVYDEKLLAEDVDLTQKQKERILLLEAKLTEWSHYRLFDVPRTSSMAGIKRGYHTASKEFHPDAYFRKDIGSYQNRINKIFVRMKKGYDVLSNKTARQTYDDSIAHIPFTKEEVFELDRQDREKELIEQAQARELRHERRREERRLNRNPLLQRLRKARDLLRLAEKALASGKTAEAGRHARLAKQYAPQDKKLVGQCNDIIGGTNVGRARAIAGRGDDLVAKNDIQGVHKIVQEVLKLAPHDPASVAAVAAMLMKIGERDDALQYAQKAVELDPGLKRAWYTLLDAAELTSKWKVAEKAAKSLLHIEGDNAKIKKRLRKATKEVRRGG
jgi:curved DNA-binding protein CbpA